MHIFYGLGGICKEEFDRFFCGQGLWMKEGNLNHDLFPHLTPFVRTTIQIVRHRRPEIGDSLARACGVRLGRRKSSRLLCEHVSSIGSEAKQQRFVSSSKVIELRSPSYKHCARTRS